MPHFIQMLTVDDNENHSLVQRAYNDFNRDAAFQARRLKFSASSWDVFLWCRRSAAHSVSSIIARNSGRQWRSLGQLHAGDCLVTTVKDVLDQKGRDVYSVSPAASVFEALKLMADQNIASLVVLDDGKLVGIMSERIYAREIILKGRTSFGTLVREVMSTRVLYARPAQSVQECMAVMAANDLRHLPVLQNDELVGVVSIGDMVKSIIGDQNFSIEQYEHYIHGDR